MKMSHVFADLVPNAKAYLAKTLTGEGISTVTLPG